MFVDASALMAILKKEPNYQMIAESLDGDDHPITSPVAVVETVISLGRQKDVPAAAALADVVSLLAGAEVRIEAITVQTGELAVKAHARFGKGTGHPARLNLGDCFAYAMATQHGVSLLYKGDDFARTDLA